MTNSDAPPSQNPPPVLSYSSSRKSAIIMDAMRSGRYLVGAAETFLPPRCVICNEPSSLPPQTIRIPAKESFRYVPTPRPHHEPAVILVHASFCARHLNRRRKAFTAAAIFGGIAVLSGAGAVACRIAGENMTREPPLTLLLWLFGVLMLLAVGIAMVIATRGLAFHHSSGGYSYLTGMGKRFVESLPTLTSSSHRPPQ
jgi:hypothetical protein